MEESFQIFLQKTFLWLINYISKQCFKPTPDVFGNFFCKIIFDDEVSFFCKYFDIQWFR